MNRHTLVAIVLAASAASGCASPDAGGAPEDSVAEQSVHAVHASPCIGLTASLYQPNLEIAAVEVFASNHVQPEEIYETRVRIPQALTIRHPGPYDLGHVAVYGMPRYGIDAAKGTASITVEGDAPGGASFVTAKKIYHAMVNVPATPGFAHGDTSSATKASTNGAISCTRWTYKGADSRYSCSFTVHESEGSPLFFGSEVSTLGRCAAI